MWARHIPLQLVDVRMAHQVNRFMGCDYNIEGFWRVMKATIGAGRCFPALHQLYPRTRQVLMAHQERPIYAWLLLDSRVVDVPRSSHLIVVTLSSLKPVFFKGLTKALPFSD